MSDLQCAARLLISRHAAADFETSVHDAGGGLSLAGRRQAKALAESLADARVATIYCSDMAPAVQTAEIVAARLDVVVRVRENLREADLEAETSDEVRQRMAEELDTIVDLHRGETVLVVSHRGAIRVAVPQLASSVPDRYGSAHDIEHCAVLEVDADADGWVLRSWGGNPV